MDSALRSIGLGSTLFHSPSSLTPLASLKFTLKSNPLSSNHRFQIPKKFKTSPSRSCIKIKASSNNTPNPIVHNLKITARAIVFASATASILGKIQKNHAGAETPATVTEEIQEKTEELQEKTEEDSSSSSPEFLESNSEAINAMKTLLQQKMEAGEDEESLKILKKLVSAQPEESEWKFLMARLLNEMGDTQEARNVFEEILAKNPLSFEALFENALLMDRCGEGEGVTKRLEQALQIAEEENKVKEARDVKLIMAQVQFLQKNVEEALRSYEELAREDPSDFRPYFCKGMIYSLLDKNSEAREQFAKYRELSPKKFEVEGYLRSPLSRMKLFGTDDQN